MTFIEKLRKIISSYGGCGCCAEISTNEAVSSIKTLIRETLPKERTFVGVPSIDWFYRGCNGYRTEVIANMQLKEEVDEAN